MVRMRSLYLRHNGSNPFLSTHGVCSLMVEYLTVNQEKTGQYRPYTQNFFRVVGELVTPPHLGCGELVRSNRTYSTVLIA